MDTHGVLTRAGARRQEAERVERARASFDLIPNDVIVSIFASLLAEPDEPDEPDEYVSDWERHLARDRPRTSNSLRWLRETFPLVCRAWRNVYYSRQASPLHATLVFDPRYVEGRRVVAWARRHARDVRKLVVLGEGFKRAAPGSFNMPHFAPNDLAELVSVVGPFLEQIDIGRGLGSLFEPQFWRALGNAVLPAPAEVEGEAATAPAAAAAPAPAPAASASASASAAAAVAGVAAPEPLPAGRLQSLVIRKIEAPLAGERDVGWLSRLTSLTELVLECSIHGDEDLDEEVAAADRGLPGFPASLVALTRLRHVDFFYHERITSLPTGISSLRNLESLSLVDCNVRALPSQLSSLRRLTKLEVGGNDLGDEGALPPELGTLTSLREIGLGNCGLRSIPTFLSSLTSLESLKLGYNEEFGLAGPFGRAETGLPAMLTTLTRLTRLKLGGCRSLTSLPPEISSLRRLLELDVSECSLLSLPAELGSLSGLTMLRANKGTEDMGMIPEATVFPEALRGMTSLRRLGASGHYLREVPAFVGSLQSLEALDLTDNDFGNADPPHLGFPGPFPVMAALTRVDLEGCLLPSLPPAALSSMPNLRVLNLAWNYIMTLPGDLGQRLPGLREIRLYSNNFAAVPAAALAGATSLEKIDCRNNIDLQVDEPLDFLVDHFPQLREVKMTRRAGEWTPASRAHLQRLAERLRERDPAAVVEF